MAPDDQCEGYRGGVKATGALPGRQGSDSKESGTMRMISDFSTKREEAWKDSKQVSDLTRYGFCLPGSHVGMSQQGEILQARRLEGCLFPPRERCPRPELRVLSVLMCASLVSSGSLERGTPEGDRTPGE